MPEAPSITSSEIGTLWITYQQKTMVLRMLEYFIEKADDNEAKQIMTELYSEINPCIDQIINIFQKEGAVIPVGFTEKDVHKDAPKLFDNGFDIMFLRMIKEISMAMHTLNITMSYREDIILLYRELTMMTQRYYESCTKYLLKKGLMTRPPYVSMPKTVEFINDTNYLSGFNPFTEKRPLNTVEMANIYHGIESNITGMQMILGFAQCAHENEVRKFFTNGGELSKRIIKEMTEVILQNDIQVPATAGGNVTNSTVAPFSDKIMMYCVSLFCSFSLGGNSLGTAFSLRNDLPAKLASFMIDIFDYAHTGAKIMIRNGWMEEPPQMDKHKG